MHANLSSTAITADIGNYRCSSASDDIGQNRPDIAVLPGNYLILKKCKGNILYQLRKGHFIF